MCANYFSQALPRIVNAKRKMHRCSFLYFRHSNLALKCSQSSVFTLVFDDDLFLGKSSMIFDIFWRRKKGNMLLMYFYKILRENRHKHAILILSAKDIKIKNYCHVSQ